MPASSPSRRRAARAIALLAALTVALLAPAAAAPGAVISAIAGWEDVPKGPPVATFTVTYAAAPGEANALDLRIDADAVSARDTGAPLSAGAGCVALIEGSVRCPLPSGPVVTIGADLGDGDDRALVSGGGAIGALNVRGGDGADRIELATTVLSVTADGGAGDDELIGGPAGERLDGGPGADRLSGGGGDDVLTGDPAEGPFGDDRLDGGPGRDTASYSSRMRAVDVDLAAGRGGSAGEHDLLTAVEDVVGGSAADTLRGDDGPNRLSGWARGGGRELIDGRGGDDELSAVGFDGFARVLGGDGADTIDLSGRGTVLAGAGDDRVEGTPTGAIVCGPGDDLVSNEETYTAHGVIGGDCEQVVEEFTRIGPLRVGPRMVVLGVARRDAAVCAVRARLRRAGAGPGARRVLA
ncbi:calcium-binding protein, partial [Conexibacter sp. JD483]|uniref:calcium-binding protein n=3 Tax=Conexibacter TaxID=191494 RepID=UPI00286FDFB3